MAVPNLQVSKDASRALEEFSDEFSSALALGPDFDKWAEILGFVRTTDALKTTFPIPLDAAGYKELKGDIKFRSLYHRSLSMTSKEWYDGVEEKARVIEAPDFIDWAGAPARMALEWMRQPNTLVADMLALSSLNGPLLDFYRDADSDTASTRRLFAADHPYNVLNESLGTFQNFTTTTVAAIRDGSFFSSVNSHFRAIKGPNGKPLGLRFGGGGTLLLPATREELFKDVLSQDTLINALRNVAGTENVAAVQKSNVYKGTKYIVADELASQDYFYCFATGKPGLHPWVVQQGSAPEEIVHDKSSELYKRSLKVGVAYIGQMAVAACLPHPVLRVQITG
jgi:hypothetical protein